MSPAKCVSNLHKSIQVHFAEMAHSKVVEMESGLLYFIEIDGIYQFR